MHFKNQLVDSKIILEKDAGIMMTIGFVEEPVRIHERRKSSHTEPVRKNASDFRADFQQIIDQYIVSGSKQCINISARVRKKILLSMPRPKGRFSLMNSMEFMKKSSRTVKTPTLDRVVSDECDDHRASSVSTPGSIAGTPSMGSVNAKESVDGMNTMQSVPGRVSKISLTAKSTLDTESTWDSARTTSMGMAIAQIAAHNLEERSWFEQKIEKLDLAVEDVIRLLKRDSLFRFYSSPEYARLIQRSLTNIDTDTLEKTARLSIGMK